MHTIDTRGRQRGQRAGARPWAGPGDDDDDKWLDDERFIETGSGWGLQRAIHHNAEMQAASRAAKAVAAAQAEARATAATREADAAEEEEELQREHQREHQRRRRRRQETECFTEKYERLRSEEDALDAFMDGIIRSGSVSPCDLMSMTGSLREAVNVEVGLRENNIFVVVTPPEKGDNNPQGGRRGGGGGGEREGKAVLSDWGW